MKKTPKKIELSRMEKILLAMYEISNGEKKNIKFEDLVVTLFQKYPDHFHLKGYPKFPDSEAINNALYHNLKRKGVINYGNKIFSLTEQGLSIGKEIKNLVKGKTIIPAIRFPKYIEGEIQRIKFLEGFKLFLNKEDSQILDTDFYDYLGVTVRTRKSDFLGRLKIIEDSIRGLSKIKEDALYKKLVEYHQFMLNKFQDIIEYKSKN